MDDKVVIVVESKNYEVSKNKLIERSSYFHSMFNTEFLERNKSTINLQGISADSWERILYFLEHGKVRPEAYSENLYKDVLDLLQAAAMLQFADLQERCTKILFDTITEKTALDILEVASKLDLAVLIQKARAVALWNADLITNTDSFFNLDPDQVEGYLSDPALHSSSGEWGIWEAIDRWINSPSDFSSPRTEFLPKLIKCINVDGLSVSDLRTIGVNHAVQASETVKESIHFIINERLRENGGCDAEPNSDESEKSSSTDNACAETDKIEIKESVRDFIEEWRSITPRKLPQVPAVIAKVNRGPDLVSPYVVRFCEEEKKFIPAIRLDEVEASLGALVGFKVIANGSKLYMLGGEIMTRQSSWYHAVWEYDQIFGRWLFLANLRREGRHFSACVIGDDLYVLGGFGRHRLIQDSVNKLSLSERIWTTCSPLPEPMYSVACCAHKGYIYVIRLQVYQYSPERDQWITLSVTVPSGKVFCNAASYEDYIYLSGRTKYVYKFNPSSPSVKMEEVGQFKYECSQSCLIENYMYSLSQDEFGEDIYCEKMNLETGESSLLWEGTVGGEIANLSPNHHPGCFPLLLY